MENKKNINLKIISYISLFQKYCFYLDNTYRQNQPALQTRLRGSRSGDRFETFEVCKVAVDVLSSHTYINRPRPLTQK